MPRGRPRKNPVTTAAADVNAAALAEEMKEKTGHDVVPVFTVTAQGDSEDVDANTTIPETDLEGNTFPTEPDGDDFPVVPVEEITQPCEQLVPAFGSEKWQEYVMTQFKETELDRAAPKCDGLRRVLQILVGPIMEETVTMLTAPCKDNDFTATVAARVIVNVTNETHPSAGEMLSYDDVADTNRFNTEAPYHKYPSATSYTRAQGRIFRKMLGLSNVYAAEEVSEKAAATEASWEIDDPINDGQITVIDTMCKRLDLSVVDFINSGKLKYANIHSIGTTTAQSMIQELNKFQRNVKEKPNFNKYDPNWKT